MKPKILVVDDDKYTIKFFEGLFRGKPVEADYALDAERARRQFRQADYNLVLMDQRLPDGNGLELLREMRRERPQQLAILMTGFADTRDAVRAVRDGLFDYLTKPFENLEELETVIERALELDRAYREIGSLRESLSRQKEGLVLIGSSPAIEKLLQQIRQVAPLDTTILLEGESGTGKELVARVIHALSARSGSPFLEVNCGALPEQLLESSLFGYEKGAFTGAMRTKAGYFEEADGGTLMLDEVADMSPKLQSSLLTVLQEHSFTRLGSTKSRLSDFRLICATNRQLAGEVAEGRFREDLFYRVNVVALRIPPLRERREDIIPLALHFLQHFNDKFGKAAGPFSPEAMRDLERFSWPGNVRQLKHCVERLVALGQGEPITTMGLEQCGVAGVEAGDRPGLGSGGEPDGLLPFQQARQAFERDYVGRLLEATGGNVSEAARISGISRQNLHVRINRSRTVSEK
ncbi:MAG: sigma-54-dependent Fis family transcriptional regulator [Rhodospirillales bacterium]|nr:sigma-54-dependent Fis family transcriptional regulator [Rhodospirillales bacterium]